MKTHGENVTDSILGGVARVQTHGERVADRMEKAFESHVQYFEKQVLIPFCDAHNLRFSSAMGCYGFTSAMGRTLDEPQEMRERYELVTNQVKFVNDPVYRDRGPMRCQSEGWRDTEPSFFQTYQDVWQLLEQEFGRYVVGFSANDYNSPGYEKVLKKRRIAAEER